MMELNVSTQELPITQSMSATESFARSVWAYVAAYLYRRALRRAERELMNLDDRMLHDIGLTRSEIPAAVRRAEANLLMPIVP